MLCYYKRKIHLEGAADEHRWVPEGYRYRLGARFGQSVIHSTLAYVYPFPADGSQYMYVDKDTKQSELQISKSHCAHSCLGILSQYHRFPESCLGSEMRPIIWPVVGLTNPCSSVLVRKGPAFLINYSMPWRLYEHFFLNTASTELRKHWTSWKLSSGFRIFLFSI